MPYLLKKNIYSFFFIFFVFFFPKFIIAKEHIEKDIYIHPTNSTLATHKKYFNQLLLESISDVFLIVEKREVIPFRDTKNIPIFLSLKRPVQISPDQIKPYTLEIEDRNDEDSYIRVYSYSKSINDKNIAIHLYIVEENIKLTIEKIKVGFLYETKYFAQVTPKILFEKKYTIEERIGAVQMKAVTEDLRSYMCQQSCRKLSITTQPAEASAYLNNIFIGKTPLNISSLPISAKNTPYNIKIIKEGFIDSKISLATLVPNRMNTLSTTLKPCKQVNSLTITSTPKEADVYIDTVYQGKTPITVKNLILAQHQVKLIEKNSLESTEIINLMKQDTSVHFTLTPKNIILPPPNQLWGKVTYRHAFIATSILTLLSFGTGIYFSIAASSLRQEVSQNLNKELPGQYSAASLDLINSYDSRIKLQNNYATIFYSVSGILSAVSLFFLIKDFLVLKKKSINYIALENKKILFNFNVVTNNINFNIGEYSLKANIVYRF